MENLKEAVWAQAGITKHYRLYGLNNTQLFFTVLEAENSRSTFWQIWFWWDVISWLSEGLLVLTWMFLCIQAERVRESSLMSLLIKTLNLLNQTPIFMTSLINLNYLLQETFSKYSHLGVGVSTYEFLRDTNIQSIAEAKYNQCHISSHYI